jgi:hypothetical protein
MIKTDDGKRIRVIVDGEKYALEQTADGEEWRIFRYGLPDEDPRSAELATFALPLGEAPAVERAKLGYEFVVSDQRDYPASKELAHRVLATAGVRIRREHRMSVLDDGAYPLIDRCREPALSRHVLDKALKAGASSTPTICYVKLRDPDSALVHAFTCEEVLAEVTPEPGSDGDTGRALLAFVRRTPPKRDSAIVFALSVVDMRSPSSAIDRAFVAFDLARGES